MLTWKERRIVSNRLYHKHTDENLPYTIENLSDEAMTAQVLHFFFTESQLVYPAKFIFCNIVYAYYMQEYFQLDFRRCLNDREVLTESPVECYYDERPQVYEAVIPLVYPVLPELPSVVKTRHYFKQEFLIHDEDWADIVYRVPESYQWM